MRDGEFLTRLTIWISFLLYTIGCIFFAFGKSSRWDSATRIAWTTGCLSLLVHMVCAFEFFHNWSQTSAYHETARQTQEVVGLYWGGGLVINYAVQALWLVDVVWWWKAGLDSYRLRSLPVVIAWHSFLIFIIFNATVVFKDGVVRWVGLALTVTLCVLWFAIASHWIRSVPPRGSGWVDAQRPN